MIRNHEWYNSKELVAWPLSDTATAIADSGTRLPSNLLVDMNLWFPRDLGQNVFISSLSVGKAIVSAVISVVSDTDVVTPIAAVSAVTPEPYVQYSVESLMPGVAGWVVFGDGISKEQISSYKFSDYTQTVLLPQLVTAYDRPPITDIAKLNNNTKLTGVIRLQGGDDIEIVREYREITDIVRTAAVIRLKAKPSESVSDVTVYAKYYGPCGGRAESGTCGQPDPIEFINSVQPDCCGNINLEFRGCADVKFIQNESCSVAIGCHFGLSEACVTPDRLPDALGRLPNEYEDLCVSESIISSEGVSDRFIAFGTGSGGYTVALTDSDLDPRLPRREDFSHRTASEFEVMSGRFTIVPNSELPIYGGYSLKPHDADKFVAVLKPREYSQTCLFRSATCWFSLSDKEPGTLRNGGLIVNYNKVDKSFYSVELDQLGSFSGYKSLRIVRHDPGAIRTLVSVPIDNLAADVLYRLKTAVIPGATPTEAWLTATLVSELPTTSPLFVNRSIGPFNIVDTTPSGSFGFVAVKSATQFVRLIVDNAEDLG